LRYLGLIQVTLGGLYWHEERDLDDHNSITACLPITTDFSGNFVRDVAGVCDGTAAPGSLVSVASWQEYARQDLRPDVPGFKGAVWETDTEHMSAYLSVDWSITETLSLTLEDRYNYEKFEILRPNQASCAALGFTVLGGAFVAPLVSEAANPGEDVNCRLENAHIKVNRAWTRTAEILNPTIPPAAGLGAHQRRGDHAVSHAEGHGGVAGTDDGWSIFRRAQKPGINSSRPGRRDGHRERALQVGEDDAWELGSKTVWSVAGDLQLNGAAFYQDYSDKQVTTQILVDDKLARVTNASSADTQGIELSGVAARVARRPTLSASYTWLIPVPGFQDDTTVLPGLQPPVVRWSSTGAGSAPILPTCPTRPMARPPVASTRAASSSSARPRIRS
jgi:hypothetical protein